MTAQTLTINLLPKDEFERSFLGKFLKWALTVGRYIVIGTELVVISSFLARFSLDRQMTDLNEAMAAKQNVLASYATIESRVRVLQARLDLVKELTSEQLGMATLMTTTARLTPIDLVYTSLTYTPEAVTFQGIAFSEAGLQTLLSTMRAEKGFSKVTVKRISSAGSQGNGLDFEIEAQRSGAKTAQSQEVPRQQAAEGNDGL
ncbi:MAG: PilN domain-containing protein [Candidatus Chisholmbacteria bacterium]|nr:PilN domain-containing protein [Candidatus Chisholmbacteria bacterium]